MPARKTTDADPAVDLIQMMQEQDKGFELLGAPPNPFYEFLIKHGTRWTGSTKPRNPDDCGPKKECFSNAGKLACDKREHYLYAEGVAYNPDLGVPIIMHHGWCVSVKSGKVIDPTWDGGKLVQYVGYVFNDPVAYSELLVRYKYWGLFDHGWGYNMELIHELSKPRSKRKPRKKAAAKA